MLLLEFSLVYDTEVGRKSFYITLGILQSSILGVVLWFEIQDEVLCLKFLVDLAIVGSTDDVTLEAR